MSWLDWEEEEADSSPAEALYEDDDGAAAANPCDDVDDSPNVGDENTVESVSTLSSGPRSSSPKEDPDRTRPLDGVSAGEGALGTGRLGELRDDELVDDERGGGVRVKSNCDGPVDLVEFRSEDRRRAAKGRKPLDGRGGVDGPPTLIVDREDARRILSLPEPISPNSPASPLVSTAGRPEGKVPEG